MRKSQRRQNRQVHGKAHQYRATKEPENNHDDEATVERTRLEKALEIGLEDTFPASILLRSFSPAHPTSLSKHWNSSRCSPNAPLHSVTSSPRARNEGETSRPSVLAVLRLIASSKRLPK